jgi:Mrp family chromosome partitioning ATPase
MAVSQRTAEPSAAMAASSGTGLLISDTSCTAEMRAAYEQAALNVRYALLNASGSMVLVSSVDGTALAVPLAANLAILAAMEGQRVILANADLHAPELNTVFTFSNGGGFSELVRSPEAPDISGHLLTVADTPGLQLLTAGTAGPVPGGLARAASLEAVMLQLRKAADAVFILGSPILSYVDSLDLARLVDGVVIAVAPGRTHRLDARRASELLDRVHAPLLGVVLTRKST